MIGLALAFWADEQFPLRSVRSQRGTHFVSARVLLQSSLSLQEAWVFHVFSYGCLGSWVRIFWSRSVYLLPFLYYFLAFLSADESLLLRLPILYLSEYLVSCTGASK